MIRNLKIILLFLPVWIGALPGLKAAGPPVANPPPWIKERAGEIDLNHDYTLTWTEFQAEIDKTIPGYDSNRDGQLSLSEYGTEGRHSTLAGYVTFHAKQIDANSDTTITTAELVAHARTMFDAFDTDLDGRITAIEFAALELPIVSFKKESSSASGVLRLEARPESGTVYKIQHSADLLSWKPILALAPTNQGPIEVKLTNAAAKAYYRVAIQDLPFVTQGLATTIVPTLGNFPGGRVAKVGTIMSTNGIQWTVPAATSFATGPKASDLYNQVTGVTPANIAQVNLNSVPVVEVDPDGKMITGYLFADNYFELYVNGKLVAVDPVPYTPFNSCIVRFKAKAPITYAIRLVDWEENLGIGSEVNQGNPYYAGDGGLIASFSDGTVTGSHWKAQTFYISPLASPAEVTELLDGTRDSSSSPSQPSSNANSYALHYLMPSNWFTKNFNDGGWPAATTYSEAVVGVDNKPEYTNFRAQFSGTGAKFIWSSNLVLDNDVIVRYTTL
jgi:hypothetical protein